MDINNGIVKKPDGFPKPVKFDSNDIVKKPDGFPKPVRFDSKINNRKSLRLIA
jgi:hypothetical protein